MHLYFSELRTVYAADGQLSSIIPLCIVLLLCWHKHLRKKLSISKRRTAKCFTCLFHLKTNSISYTQHSISFHVYTWQTYCCLAISFMAKLFVEWKVDWIFADSTVSESCNPDIGKEINCPLEYFYELTLRFYVSEKMLIRAPIY